MIDGALIKEVSLTKERTTLGRRPYNDVVLDNLAVSGEHAVLNLVGGQVYVEDLGSTNGTYVNGKAVKRQLLNHGESFEMGKFKLRLDNPVESADFEKTMVIRPRTPAVPAAPAPVDLKGAIRVVSGAAAGREMPLTKVVTTLGKPGVAVAAITRKVHHFALHHVEGALQPTLNGATVGAEPVVLKDGDHIALAGTQMQFLQS
jgi:hypothetical protein